jgi:hypothetical protein
MLHAQATSIHTPSSSMGSTQTANATSLRRARALTVTATSRGTLRSMPPVQTQTQVRLGQGATCCGSSATVPLLATHEFRGSGAVLVREHT